MIRKTALCLCLCGFLAACSSVSQQAAPAAPPFSLTPTSYEKLAGWNYDNLLSATEAFKVSCQTFQKKDPNQTLKGGHAGLVRDWLPACQALAANPPVTAAQARAFFEENFTPYRVNDGQEGLFTGYYQAELKGSLKKEGPYQTPLYAVPKDLIQINLGDFRDALKGQKITGKIQKGVFVPYDTRAEIAKNGMKDRAEVLAWVDDPVGAFFLEIQGSGRVQLKQGGQLFLGYGAQNGHGYVAVGKVLLDKGEITRPVSMQKIRDWFEKNPARRQEIMNANPSVVFFQKQKTNEAIGAMGRPLTVMRSLAVDPSFVPLGVPLWLDTRWHQHLVIAQDTGGAIKGAVRGDLYWGAGPWAEHAAGQMQESGSYALLLPKGVTP